MEAYAGHGPLVRHAGPTPPGRETVPEPGPTQTEVGESTFGIWEEEAYQLWLDVETLYQVRDNIDPNSLRVAEIDQALRDFTVIVDFELPHEERLATFRAGRARLKPLLECVNGSTAPTLFAFGHAHIDVAWLWPLAETERKCARTFSTQLALMEEYPEFKFLQSQPHLYRMRQDALPGTVRADQAGGAGRQVHPRRRHVGGAGHQHHRRREPHPPVHPRQAVLPRGVWRRQRTALAAGRVRLFGRAAADHARLRHQVLCHGQDLLDL